MQLQFISAALRKLGLLRLGDDVRFLVARYKNRKQKKDFISKYPHIKLPPDYLIYESFQLDYFKYYEGGKLAAMHIISLLENHLKLTGGIILDWGCGPARLTRHLPGLLEGLDCTLFGSDYNSKTIDWCKKNIAGISFKTNGLLPPLDFDKNSVDAIIGVSIFTHLSEVAHELWMQELTNKLKPGGLAIFTTQGDSFVEKLSLEEKNDYSLGKLVVRDRVKEGHRIFSAFQPRNFMLKLIDACTQLEFVEHIKGTSVTSKPEQDIWIVRKR